MKKICLIFISLLSAMSIDVMANQADTLSLKDIVSGTFSPKYVGGIRPMDGASTYSRISEDKNRIESFYYKNGKLCKVLFDKTKAKLTANDTLPEFDDYSISPDGTKILLRTDCRPVYRRSNKAKYFVFDSMTNTVTPLADTNEVQNPVWSNNGKMIAYVLANNIYLKSLELGSESLEKGLEQVTKDGKKNEIINGIPDWVYEEEFTTANSMCFTSDDKSLCWLRYDESKVPVYYLQVFDDGKKIHSPYTMDPSSPKGLYSYKYPQAGETNSTVTAWSYDIATGKTRQFALPVGKEDYIPRLLAMGLDVKGNKTDKAILVTLNRHQDSLCVYQADPKTGACKLIIKKMGDRYFKEMVVTDMRIQNSRLIIPNDLEGNVSVDIYDLNGNLIRNVACKDHDIVAVYGMDKKGRVYYQAAYPTPIDRSVFREQTDLTKKAGYCSARFSGDFNYFVKVWSDANTPYVYSIADNNGKDIKILEDNKVLRDKIASYNLPKLEFFSLTTADNITLNGWRIKPSMSHESTDARMPLVMHQYSGPGSQQVLNSWSVGSMGNSALYDKYLAQKGIMTACVDGRGTGARGTAFEKCTYQKLGQTECHDQIEAAKWFAKQPDVDPQRIAIWGWSFGGFNTLMCMTSDENVNADVDTHSSSLRSSSAGLQGKNPLFRCGVAIAPPTAWRYYDSVYTERYMRTPQENPDGYDVCPLSRAQNLNGELLIMHGLADDNVHPQNTLEFTEALVQADKDFRMQLYTNRNHGIRGGNTRNHLLRQVTNWFTNNLK